MICWVSHTGMVGGYPVKVQNYWEGLYNQKTFFWITRLSNDEWHLVSSGPSHKSGISIRDKDVDKLKQAAVSQMVEQGCCKPQVPGSTPGGGTTMEV